MKTFRYGVFLVLLLLPSLMMARTRKTNDGEPQTLAELLDGLSLASPSQWYQGMPFIFLNERVGLSLTAEVPAEATDTVNMRFVSQYARFEEMEQGFDNSSFTSIGPNNQFDSPSQVFSSKMNDDDSMESYNPSITTDEPTPF